MDLKRLQFPAANMLEPCAPRGRDGVLGAGFKVRQQQGFREMGADAIIAMRYDANEITDGITEVLAYGTAVRVEKAN